MNLISLKNNRFSWCKSNSSTSRAIYQLMKQFANSVIKRIGCLWKIQKRTHGILNQKNFFEKLGLEVYQKESSYTSIHYLVKPHAEFPFCCEIQVRTLFEEIWGEIDHSINYPVATTSIAIREQLRVLAKLVGAGSRLADAIFRTHLDLK